MSFASDGFLARGMAHFPTSLRSIKEYGQWFAFIEKLNRLGHDIVRDVPLSATSNQQLFTAGLFIRSLKSLQAAVILCERGLTADARSVLRSAFEGAIALNAIAKNPNFTDQMIEAHHFNNRKLANFYQRETDYCSDLSPEQIAIMHSQIREADEYETEINKGKTPPRKLREINWSDTAKACDCRDLYDMLYRQYSSDGTHTTLDALTRMFDYDTVRNITNIKVGPDNFRLIDTLKGAALLFIWSASPLDEILNSSRHHARILEIMEEFRSLPKDDPPNARIEGVM